MSRDPGHHVFLVPGDLYCAEEPTVMTTILGSCIAVCLWDRVLCVGGMNHFVLPTCEDGPSSARYGDTAINHLIEGMRRLGSRPGNLDAKLFGGAAVLPVSSPEDTVGGRNTRLAFAHLHERRIPVIAHRTGGEVGLYIRFYTRSGDVLVRPITSTREPPAASILKPVYS